MSDKKNEIIIKVETDSKSRVSDDEVVIKNNEFLEQLKGSILEDSVSRDEDLKEAMREDSYEALLARKKGKEPEVEKPEIEIEEEFKMANAINKQYVSLKFGVVGSGQAGGRIAEVFYKQGYAACAVNTARQDLEFLDIPEENKLFIGNESIGGSGKDLDVSADLFMSHEDEVVSFIDNKLGDCDAFILTVSGSGGTGSGSAELLSEWLGQSGKPLIVIYVLPGSFDSVQGKHNALQTLERLSDLCKDTVINSLVLVDNAAIEAAYPDLPQAKFFKTANEAVVMPLHTFNRLSATSSDHESLDSMDFAKALIESNGCCVFGTNVVPPDWYEQDETALMEAIISGLDDGLLARGFDLKEAQNVGILVSANAQVLERVPYMNIAYMFKYIADEFKSANAFKGVYAVPTNSDDITVHFIFSGMGLPKDRVESLRKESEDHQKNLQEKREKLNLEVGPRKDRASRDIDNKIAKIKKRNSGTSRLLNPGSGKKRPRRR